MVYLSKRETEILKLLSDGYTTEEIATKLFLSNHTVESHRKKLLQKFEAKNSNHLIKKAFLQGFITILNPTKRGNFNPMPLKILMVDDDKGDQEIFEDALDSCGGIHKVSFANNGLELIDYLTNISNDKESKFPDLIFLDLNMPIKDGREALKELKKSKQFSKIPVFIYSTCESEDDVNLCYREGANLFITKPSDYQKISVMLNNVCQIISEYIVLPN